MKGADCGLEEAREKESRGEGSVASTRAAASDCDWVTRSNKALLQVRRRD